MKHNNRAHKIALNINDKESCNYIIHGLKYIQENTRNFNAEKINSLLSTMLVIKESLKDKAY